jgi:ATP-binding cassette, subfamily B, bacterial PglK
MNINKIRNLLEKQKGDFIILSLVMFCLSIIELLSVGALMPFLVVATEIKVSNNYFFNLIIEKINIYNFDDPLKFSLIIIFVIFSFKTLIVVILNFYKNVLLKRFHFSTSKEIMRNYINMPYSKFIKINTSRMVNTINREVELLITSVLNPLIVFTLESFTILVFLTFIFFFDRSTFFLIFGFIAITIGIFVLIFGKKIKQLGKKRLSYQNKIQKDVIQSLHGIREVKIFNKQDFFLNIFLSRLKKIIDITVIFNTISESQRNIIEFLSIVFFTFIVFVLSFSNDVSEILITIAFLFAIFVRLLPSINKLYISLQSIRYYYPTIDNIYNDLIKVSDTDTNQKKQKNKNFQSLEIKNGNFKYLNEYIFKDLNFKIEKNDFIGIYGESGSGKSTLVDIISGLLKINGGELLINGKKIENNEFNFSDLIGYVTQNTYLLDDTIKNNIAFGENDEDIDEDKLKKVLNISSLDFVNNLSEGIYSKAGDRGISLSGGQMQRVSIARTLYKNSELLILDEATSSLDKRNEIDFMNIVKGLKNLKTMIIISHKKELFNDCNKIFEVKNKSLVKIQ